jgi:very-short-patch-repair endonuclease
MKKKMPRKDSISIELSMTREELDELCLELPENSKYRKIFDAVVKKSFIGKKPKQAKVETATSSLLSIATKYRKELIKKATIQESVFRSFLEDFKIKYIFQKIEVYGNKFYIVDFYLPDYNWVVEIDGNHHYTEEYLASDEERTKHLKEIRIDQVYRIKNSECTRAKLINWWATLATV